MLPVAGPVAAVGVTRFATVRGVVAPLGRFRQLASNARDENLLSVRYRSAAALDSPDLGRRLRVVLERSGGMFVKFGQIAATRTDLLPSTITDELSHLHADVERIPPDQLEAVLEGDLGEPVAQAFSEFEYEPLAAASVGQTHRATLHGGHPVVVKVQRPGMEELVRRDGSVLTLVARTLERRVEAARRVGAQRLAEELVRSIEAELDYRLEAKAGTRLRSNRADDQGVAIPAVHGALTTGRVLVMDEVKGRPLTDADAVDAVPVPRPELARRLLASFLGQILKDGYYHADPHPGNVLLDSEGTLWLLDFGSVGRLDPVTLESLQGIALGFSMRDASLIARAVRHLVGDDRVDMRVLERDMSLLLGEAQGGGFSPAVLGGVLDVMERHGLRPPSTMLLLSRTMLTLEGTLRAIDPRFSLPAEATALVASEGLADIGTPEELLRRELVRALPALRTLPEHAETLAGQLRSGRLVVRSEHYAGRRPPGRRGVARPGPPCGRERHRGLDQRRDPGRRLDDGRRGHPHGALDPGLLGSHRDHRAGDAYGCAKPARAIAAGRAVRGPAQREWARSRRPRPARRATTIHTVQSH